MKNSYFTLILLFCGLSCFSQLQIQNFQVNMPLGQTFVNPDQFDYQFEIKGTPGWDEVKLWVYEQSISSENLIGLIRWNREGDNYLDFPTFTQKTTWFSIFRNLDGSTRTISMIPCKTFWLVVEYQGVNQEILSYSFPDQDSDSDGLLDCEDDCPNQDGPASNNGCPNDFDISIDAFRIFQRASFTDNSFQILYEYSQTDDDFEIEHTADIQFAPRIKMEGSATSSLEYNLKIVAYNYTGNLYPNVPTNNSNEFVEFINNDLLIESGTQEDPVSDYEFGDDGPIFFTSESINSLFFQSLEVEFGSLYALSVIVEPIGWTDVDNSNNQINIFFNYNGNQANSQPNDPPIIKFPKDIITLKNMSSFKVSETFRVNNQDEENALFQSMKKGDSYIIRESDGSTTRVIKQ